MLGQQAWLDAVGERPLPVAKQPFAIDWLNACFPPISDVRSKTLVDPDQLRSRDQEDQSKSPLDYRHGKPNTEGGPEKGS